MTKHILSCKYCARELQKIEVQAGTSICTYDVRDISHTEYNSLYVSADTMKLNRSNLVRDKLNKFETYIRCPMCTSDLSLKIFSLNEKGFITFRKRRFTL